MKIAMLFFFNKRLYLLALILSCAIGFFIIHNLI